MSEESEQARNWVYYQDLLRHHGFEGVTDLLTRYERLKRLWMKSYIAAIRAGHSSTDEERHLAGECFAKDVLALVEQRTTGEGR